MVGWKEGASVSMREKIWIEKGKSCTILVSFLKAKNLEIGIILLNDFKCWGSLSHRGLLLCNRSTNH